MRLNSTSPDVTDKTPTGIKTATESIKRALSPVSDGPNETMIGDRAPAEPATRVVTNTQLLYKTARRGNDAIEVKGCGIWAIRL